MKMKKLLSLLTVVALFGIAGCSDGEGDKPADTTKLPTDADIALAQLCDAAPEVEITTPALSCHAPNCYAAVGAKGGTGSYLIAVDGLEGLAANYGVIQGAATEGTRNLNVTVTDANCIDKQATGTVVLTIAAAPPVPEPTTPSVPVAPTPCGSPADLTLTVNQNPGREHVCRPSESASSCVYTITITGGEGPFEVTPNPTTPQWLTVGIPGPGSLAPIVSTGETRGSTGPAPRTVAIVANTRTRENREYRLNNWSGNIQVTDTACRLRQQSVPFRVTMQQQSAAETTPPAAPATPQSCTVADARVTFVTAWYAYSGTTTEATVKFCKAAGTDCKSYTMENRSEQYIQNKKETYTLRGGADSQIGLPFDCDYLNRIVLRVEGGNDSDNWYGWILEGFRVDAKINGAFTRADGTQANPIANTGWTAIYNNPSVFVSLRDQDNRRVAVFTPNDTAVGIEIKTGNDESNSGTNSNIKLHLPIKTGFTIPQILIDHFGTGTTGLPYWLVDDGEIIRTLRWHTSVGQDDFESGDTASYGGYFPFIDPIDHKYSISSDDTGDYSDWKPEYFKVAFIRPGEKKYLEDRNCDGSQVTINKWFDSSHKNWPSDFSATEANSTDYYTPRTDVTCPFPPISLCSGGNVSCNAR